MKLLAIDYGDSKLGLALGDTESRVALPYKILKNSGWDDAIDQIKNICATENIGKIIIGSPINGAEQMKRVDGFIEQLKKTITLEIIKQDERFTTQEAARLSPNRSEDDVAAMLILQSHLDSLV